MATKPETVKAAMAQGRARGEAPVGASSLSLAGSDVSRRRKLKPMPAIPTRTFTSAAVSVVAFMPQCSTA
jgi:hypothetical protein